RGRKHRHRADPAMERVKTVETLHPAETSHVWCVFSFRATKSFHVLLPGAVKRGSRANQEASEAQLWRSEVSVVCSGAHRARTVTCRGPTGSIDARRGATGPSANRIRGRAANPGEAGATGNAATGRPVWLLIAEGDRGSPAPPAS